MSKEQANAKRKAYEVEIGKLWKIMQNMTPEKRAQFVEQLQEDTVTALRSHANPYKKPVFIGDRNRYLAFSVINLTEKYSQRFAMTSLIGFLYRMLDEFTPAAAKQYLSENDPKFANVYNAKIKQLTASKPEQLLTEAWNALKTEIEAMKADLGNETSEANQRELKSVIKAKIKESFVVRAKLIKYKTYSFNRELESLKDNQNYLQMRVQSSKQEVKQLQELKEIYELKLKLRLEYDAAHKTEETADDELDSDMPALESNRELNPVVDPSLPSEDIDENGEVRTLKNTLTIQDVNQPLENFYKVIENKTKNIEIVSKRIAMQETELNERSSKLETLEKHIKEYKDRLAQLKTEYDQLFCVGTKKTEKNFKKAKTHALDSVEVEQYDPSETELDAIAEETKRELNITKTAEEFTEEYQIQVQEFLDEYLVYNPDNHVRCAYKPNYEDPLRTPLEMHKLAKEKEAEYERTLIPPDDTFFRLNRYIENNYEELRQATDDIYCEKSDFEFAIVPLEVFEDEDKDRAEEKLREFQRKYADEFDCEVFSAKFGIWGLMGSWAQNRQVRDFYTEKTEIIKRILDQHKDDARMGQKLMKDRAEKKKKENEAETGAHSNSFDQHRKNNPPVKLEKHGAKHVSDIHVDDFVEVKDVPRDMDESTEQEVEVDVHHIKPKFRKGGRRIAAYGERFKFNIPSEKLPDGATQIDNPAQYHKRLKEKKEKKKV